MNTAATDIPTCTHYYVVAPAAGPTSLGICKRCQIERVFYNIVIGYDDVTVRQSTKRLYNHRGPHNLDQTYRIAEEEEDENG